MLGIEELVGPADAGVAGDRPEVPPGSVRITGTVVHTGLGTNDPLPGALVELVSKEAGSDGAMVIADAAGDFELIVAAENNLDVFLRSTDPMGSVNPSITLFLAPLTADVVVTLQNLDAPSLQQLASVCGAPGADPNFPFFAIAAVAGSGPVPGVPVTTTPAGQLCATNNGMPMPSTTTGIDGYVFGFGIPPGPVEVRVGFTTRIVDAPPMTSVFVPIQEQ